MPSSPDTLWVLLTGFASMAWSTALESTLLGLPNFARLSGFLQPQRNFFHCLVTVLWSTAPSLFAQQMYFWLLPWRYGSVRRHKASVPEFVYFAHSYARFFSHTWNEAMYWMLTHQLSRYYQPQGVPFSRLALLRSRDILAANYYVCKYCKTFDSPSYLLLNRDKILDTMYNVLKKKLLNTNSKM